MNKQRIKASKVFYYLHKIAEENDSFAMDKVEAYLSKKNRRYFMNSYYDMTMDNILWYIKNCKSLKEAHKELLEEYKPYYANAWFENLVYVLGQ